MHIRLKKTSLKRGVGIVRTFGEIFPDGSVLELVAAASGDHLNLLLRNGEATVVAPQIEYGGNIYQPHDLDESIVRAIRFPREPENYGTVGKLFAELTSLLEQHQAFSKPEAERTAYWIIASWFCDCLPSPLTLWVSGADMGRAMTLFRQFRCLCRRALLLSGITRAGFLSLPLSLHPTLLLSQPSLPRSVQDLLRESNYRDLFIPRGRGRVLDVTCAKAIFAGMEGSALPSSAGTLHLPLLPVDSELPILDERALTEIADYFLPRLLKYRLEYAQKIRESRFAVKELKLPTRELARNLGACIQGDADLALRVIPLLQSQDDVAFDLCNLDSAIVEILWPRLHSGATEGTAGEIRIEEELMKDANTFLRCCGETWQYSREEVGKRLACLGLARQRKNFGMVLLLDRQTSRRVHQLARGYGIGKKVPECLDCQEGADPRRVMVV